MALKIECDTHDNSAGTRDVRSPGYTAGIGVAKVPPDLEGEALVGIMEAVEIRRILAAANPATYQPDLVASAMPAVRRRGKR